MIVKNESACLGDCLSSVRSIADEIVVGDTGSTDDSRAIAVAHDARVIDVPWTDDFAAARNATIAAATGDWLLHMDADEALDTAGAAAIRDLVDADGGGVDAIELTLANYCSEPRSWHWVTAVPDDVNARGHAGYLAAPLLRLFRNGRGYEYREAIHENITGSVTDRGGKIGIAPILIHHYGFAASGPKAEAKAAAYLAMCRKKADQCPDDSKAWHDLAEQLFAVGHTDEAATACDSALSLNPTHLGAGSLKANILLNEGRLPEAKVVLEKLGEAGHREPHIATGLAAIALREGLTEEAVLHARRATAAERPNIMGLLTLARALDVMGDAQGAREQLETAQAAAPAIQEIDDRLTAWNLREAGEAAAKIGNFEEALQKFVEALRVDREDPVAHNDVGVVSHQLGQPDKAKASFKRALLLAPGLEPARHNLEMF
jgi:Flp pilus assembly protein TadD